MNGRLIEREGLSPGEREAMRALLCGYFLGVTPDVFERDLAGKDYAILLTDGGGTLRGFTTLALARVRVEDEELSVVYSGDTIVDAGARASFALAATWIDSIRRLRVRSGCDRTVWLLICSSPRTYHFLPLFFQSYWPRADAVTPSAVRRLMDELARERYADAYDPARGIVRLTHPQRIRPGLQGPAGAARDEHDLCFLRANPGYARGDELVCFTELEDANLTPAGLRMVRCGERKRLAAGYLAVGTDAPSPASDGLEHSSVAPPGGAA